MKTYGMFSDLGNMRVAMIVAAAKLNGWKMAQVNRELAQLADSSYDRFGEATDTVVREAVFSACGFYEPTKKVKSLMTGKEVEIPVNTPRCCDPSTELYWSM